MQTKRRVVILFLIVAGMAALLYLFPPSQWVLRLVGSVRRAGATGAIAYFLVYVFAAILLFPESILTMGAGFLYGPLWGTALVSPASVIGATLAFLCGRFLARDWVAGRIAANPKFAAIDSSIGLSGFQIVFLLRLSPLFPYNLLNYGLGLTRVRLREFVLASFIGMLPGTFLYAYLGSSVTTAARLFTGRHPGHGPWGHMFFFAGLAATAAVTGLIARSARKALGGALAIKPRGDNSKVGAILS